MTCACNLEILSLAFVLTTIQLLLAATATSVNGQETHSQNDRSIVIRNLTSSDSRKDTSVILNTGVISQPNLLSLIIDGIGEKTDQRTVGRPGSDNVTGQRNVYLVQQHYGGTTFFNRSWDEYKFGFGDVTANYWIGNERLHQLTKDGNYKLRVDLEARFNGRYYWAEYQVFRVWDESTQYRLDVGGYTGTAGDSFAVHNGMKFSTRDRDNDLQENGSCAIQEYNGNNSGFWFNHCKQVNINSPSGGPCGFSWFRLPIGSGWNNTSLLTSRLILLPKGTH